MAKYETSPPRLSVELYRSVVENIARDDTSTLWALLQVSRTLNIEAERILYRCLRVDGTDRQAKLYSRLIACERVARHVRHITLRSRHLGDQSDLPRVCKALAVLHNLKSLTLDRVLDNKLAAAICGCTFQLESFESQYVTCSDKLFRALLVGQPLLRCLSSIHIPSLVIPRTAVPDLSVLYALNDDILRVILPGRHIKYLAHHADDKRIPEDLVEPLHGLRGCMVYPTRMGSRTCAPAILEHIPNAEYLTLAGFELSVASGLRAGHFPRLRGLVVQVPNDPEIGDTPVCLLAELRTLEFVELVYWVTGTGGALSGVRMRWERDAEPRRIRDLGWSFPFTEESF